MTMERLSWFERLMDEATSLDERIDVTNRLLLEMLTEFTNRQDSANQLLLSIAEALGAVEIPLGRPVSKLNRETTTAQTYIDIVEWEIPAGHTGELFQIALASSNYTKTQFRLVLANAEQWTDKYHISAFTHSFKANRLTETMKVLIQAKSSDGTSITAYGSIAGKLIPPPYREVGDGMGR